MTYKNIFKHIIWWTLSRFHLHIRKDYPRESHYFLKDYFGDKLIKGAEIGVQYGENSKWFFKMLNIKKMYLVDPYLEYEDSHDGRTYVVKNPMNKIKEIASNCLYSWEHEKKLRWIYETSDEAFKRQYIPEDLDFIYIDANHNYEFVKRDIENSWKQLKKGGLLIGHDFTFYSVAKAVIEFAEKNKLKVITKARDWEWIIVKE